MKMLTSNHSHQLYQHFERLKSLAMTTIIRIITNKSGELHKPSKMLTSNIDAFAITNNIKIVLKCPFLDNYFSV